MTPIPSAPLSDALRYKRSRFTTRLPLDRRYTAAHVWLAPEAGATGAADRVWRIGFTKFAARMLGEVVEFGFEVEPGGAVELGAVIGWMEGFKASTDLYSVVDGTFVAANPGLTEHPERAHADPYGEGWIYRVSGTPDPESVDAQGYAAILDRAIDRIQGEAHAEEYTENEPDEDPACRPTK